MFKNIYIVFFITITPLFGTSAHAGIFKWVDANGLTHYSDKAPEKRQVQTLNIGSNTNTKVPRMEPTTPQTKVVYDLELIGKKTSRTAPVQKTMPDPAQAPARSPEDKPDLFAAEYDMRKTPQKASPSPMNTIRNKLCTDARLLKAAVEEEGFASYFDEAGNYQLDWGTHEVYKGERQYLSEQQVTEIAKEIDSEVEQYCDDPSNQKLQDDARANWVRSEYCNVSKALLLELDDPVKRTAESEISKQAEEVERFCAKLGSGEHRGDDRYYPKALAAKVIN